MGGIEFSKYDGRECSFDHKVLGAGGGRIKTINIFLGGKKLPGT